MVKYAAYLGPTGLDSDELSREEVHSVLLATGGHDGVPGLNEFIPEHFSYNMSSIVVGK